ncbi:NADPH-dependent F420 reductase [Planotetraspora mira]|uniref:NADPH-dependent F420 reductase n=1 Tax=Planotetraspora mira TaxID=58121 RepID=UPI00366D6F0A
MSTITFIGTGNMARTIGTLAVAGGNTVEVMGRDQSKADALAKVLGGGTTTGRWGAVPAGDIVITSLLYGAVVPVVAAYGDALAGKTIVDISNPFNATFDGLAHSEQTSVAQEVAKVAPARCGRTALAPHHQSSRPSYEGSQPGKWPDLQIRREALHGVTDKTLRLLTKPCVSTVRTAALNTC